MRYFSFLFISAILFSACNNTKKSDYSKASTTDTKTTEVAISHPGKVLLQNKCNVCHSPTASEKGRVGPPMVAIKSHYLEDNMSKVAFADAMWQFVKQPSKANAKLKGAVKRFGVMPYQPFAEKDIRQIADYMYSYKIEEPAWFKAHINEKKGKMQYRNSGKTTEDNLSATAKTPAQRGMQYAMATKKELGKNLMGAIQQKGTLAAVNFCNKQAYPITDSMAVAQQARIKRVSDKPRNPKNKANAKELGLIAQFKKAIAHNETYTPVTEIKDDEVHFYAPITTNSMCLQCHGTPKKEIQPKVWQRLSQLYPTDMAVGYKVNEVRGL